jgi:hypothetical protein
MNSLLIFEVIFFPHALQLKHHVTNGACTYKSLNLVTATEAELSIIASNVFSETLERNGHGVVLPAANTRDHNRMIHRLKGMVCEITNTCTQTEKDYKYTEKKFFFLFVAQDCKAASGSARRRALAAKGFMHRDEQSDAPQHR